MVKGVKKFDSMLLCECLAIEKSCIIFVVILYLRHASGVSFLVTVEHTLVSNIIVIKASHIPQLDQETANPNCA